MPFRKRDYVREGGICLGDCIHRDYVWGILFLPQNIVTSLRNKDEYNQDIKLVASYTQLSLNLALFVYQLI